MNIFLEFLKWSKLINKWYNLVIMNLNYVIWNRFRLFYDFLMFVFISKLFKRTQGESFAPLAPMNRGVGFKWNVKQLNNLKILKACGLMPPAPVTRYKAQKCYKVVWRVRQRRDIWTRASSSCSFVFLCFALFSVISFVVYVHFTLFSTPFLCFFDNFERIPTLGFHLLF